MHLKRYYTLSPHVTLSGVDENGGWFLPLCRSRKDEGQKVPANVISGNSGRGVGPDSTGKMNSFGTGNCDPARTPQRFCARPRGPHGASLGPCAGGVGVPARAWGRAGGALECAVWVQTAQRYEIGASGWLPGGPSTRTATAQPLGDLAAPQRTGDPPVGSCVGEGAGDGRGAPVRRPHNTLAMWLLAVATRQPSAAVRARVKYVTFSPNFAPAVAMLWGDCVRNVVRDYGIVLENGLGPLAWSACKIGYESLKHSCVQQFTKRT
jgi:hypothetical protein